MLNMDLHDIKQRVTKDALAAEIRANEAVLLRCQQGEARYAGSQGWLDTEQWANDGFLTQMEQIAKQVRDTCDAFVIVGVGGSNNAARSVIKALRQPGSPEIIYAGNTLSPHALSSMLRSLEGKDYAIDVIAKNFETLEPGSSFRILREHMAKRYTPEEAARRTICTGTYGSSLEALCSEQGYTFVPFPTDIGGRYSAVSQVGLLPMAVAGVDIRGLVKGAHDMQVQLHTTHGEDNLALRYACLRNLYYRNGYKLELLSCFEPQMAWFFKWWIQLFAESEGKDGKGLYPVAAEYSEELHAVGQFIQDGTPLMFETFLDVEDAGASLVIRPDGKQDYFDYLNGKDFADINRAAFNATVTAHSDKLPCLILHVPAIDAYHFGQLFYFFQFVCYVSGSILGIDPFDQPGVEAYKGWMFKALGK